MAFLKVLECRDCDTDEGWELLDIASAYYSGKAYIGLSRNQYFLPEAAKAAPDPQEPASAAVSAIKAPETEETVKAAASDVSVPETVAEAVTQETVSVPLEKDADDPEAERWHKLGIDDPQNYLYTITDRQFSVEKSPKAALEFSSKKFENDIKRHGHFSDNVRTLRSAFDMACTSPTMLFSIFGDGGNYTASCDHLLKLGYLQKYTVSGYSPFYTLTERGYQIFTTQSSAKLLDRRKSQANDEA